MRLDTLALVLVAAFALLWVLTLTTGLILMVPFGILGLIPVAVIIGLIAAVIHQRLNNAEDNYYDKTVDK